MQHFGDDPDKLNPQIGNITHQNENGIDLNTVQNPNIIY